MPQVTQAGKFPVLLFLMISGMVSAQT